MHALSRISQYISQKKKRVLFKTFVTSQINYYPLVWMCHSRVLNNMINNIHHRTLWIVYQDKKGSFAELLQKNKSVSVHIKKLQYLAKEIVKLENGLSPIILNEVFHLKESESYKFSSGIHLAKRNIHTAHFGTDILFRHSWTVCLLSLCLESVKQPWANLCHCVAL